MERGSLMLNHFSLLTTLQPLCCKMLPVPLWTKTSAQRARGREERGIGKCVAMATEHEHI